MTDTTCSGSCSELEKYKDLLSLALDRLQKSLEEKQELRQQLLKLRKK